jgi:hypothetical protein
MNFNVQIKTFGQFFLFVKMACFCANPGGLRDAGTEQSAEQQEAVAG